MSSDTPCIDGNLPQVVFGSLSSPTNSLILVPLALAKVQLERGVNGTEHNLNVERWTNTLISCPLGDKKTKDGLDFLSFFEYYSLKVL